MKMMTDKLFGEHIKYIRLKKSMSIRQIGKKLKNIDISKYSKIERGIQNPRDKKEFLEIIEALEINEPELIKTLEIKAMKYIDVKELSEKDIIKQLPLIIPSKIDTKEKLEKFYKKFKEYIIKSNSPE